MFSVSVSGTLTIDKDALLQAVQNSVQQTAVIAESSGVARRTMTPNVPESQGNVNWTSVKQARLYHATRGFGRGDSSRNNKYQRSGRLQRSWEYVAISTPDGAVLVTQNVARDTWNPVFEKYYATFVIGEQQQRFHAGRYPNINTTMPDYVLQIASIFEQTLSANLDSKPIVTVRR